MSGGVGKGQRGGRVGAGGVEGGGEGGAGEREMQRQRQK